MKRTTLLTTYATTGFVILLSLVSSIIIARFLGPEARGQLMALTFWPGFLAAILCLAINEATAYHVAHAVAAGDNEVCAAYCSSGLGLQLMLGVALAAIVTVLLPVFLRSRPGELGIAMALAAVFVPSMLCDLHFKAVAQGRGQFAKLNLLRLLQPSVYSIILVWLHLTATLTVTTAMAAMVATVFSSAVFGLLVSRIELRRASRQATQNLLATGVRFHVANLLMYGGNEVDKLLVLLLLIDRDIGYYSVALAVAR